MTFLEPLLLWGLPLISIPIIIHLMNRMRHKPKKWAAMEFLFMAKRSSTKISNLKNLLILLCRCLVILFFILALSRPLAGSLFGWSVSTPDTVFILLDRSASMSAVTTGAEKTRLEKGIENIREAAKSIPGNPKLVFIDSATNKARSLSDINQLDDKLLFGETQTETDITEMLNSTLKYAIDNKTGNSEVWLVSDMQKTNWNPESEVWTKLMAQYEGLDQKMGFKVLSLTGETNENSSIRIIDSYRKVSGDGTEVQLVFEIRKTDVDARQIPVTFSIEGNEVTREFHIDGQSLTVQHNVQLDAKLNNKSGFGSISIPDDGNNGDNTAFFAFDPPPQLKAALAVADNMRSEFLQIASAPAPDIFQQESEILKDNAVEDKTLDKTSLVVVDGVNFTEKSQEKLKKFVEEGGNVLLFPSGKPGESLFGSISLGEIDKTDTKNPYRIARWEENLGPLTKSASGSSLPMKNIQVLQRQPGSGKGQVLASFEDGTGFLTRYNFGRGQVYYCSTLVEKNWSNLIKGSVLVPMLHRLQEEGSRRLSRIQNTVCGDFKSIGEAKPVSVKTTALPGSMPGVYTRGETVIVLNRPISEDESGVVETADLQKIFGSVALNLQEAVQREDDEFKTNLWTPLMVILFLFFIMEGWLTKRSKPVNHELPEAKA